MCTAMMTGLGGMAGYPIAALAGTAAAVVLVLVVLLVVLARRPRPALAPRPEHPAIALLKERLARGEIDPEEFEQRLFSLLAHDQLR